MSDWKIEQQRFLDQLVGRIIKSVHLSDAHGHQLLIEFQSQDEEVNPHLYVCTEAAAKFFKDLKDRVVVRDDRIYLRIDDAENPAWDERVRNVHKLWTKT